MTLYLMKWISQIKFLMKMILFNKIIESESDIKKIFIKRERVVLFN